MLSNSWIVLQSIQRNWVFVTNSDFIIPLSLESNVVNLLYFKLILFDLKEFIVCGKDSIPLHFKASYLFKLILRFSNPYILPTQCCRPRYFTMNSVRSNKISLKFQSFPPSGCKEKRTRKSEFLAKTCNFFVL